MSKTCSTKKLCDDENCKTCFKKSFASNPRSKYWSDKNMLNPRQVFRAATKKFIFDCNICNHEFLASLNAISKGTWCIYCANQKLCNDPECDACYEKSFSSHTKSLYWSDKNTLDP